MISNISEILKLLRSWLRKPKSCTVRTFSRAWRFPLISTNRNLASYMCLSKLRARHWNVQLTITSIWPVKVIYARTWSWRPFLWNVDWEKGGCPCPGADLLDICYLKNIFQHAESICIIDVHLTYRHGMCLENAPTFLEYNAEPSYICSWSLTCST
jgi:hypothetical protein